MQAFPSSLSFGPGEVVHINRVCALEERWLKRGEVPADYEEWRRIFPTGHARERGEWMLQPAEVAEYVRDVRGIVKRLLGEGDFLRYAKREFPIDAPIGRKERGKAVYALRGQARKAYVAWVGREHGMDLETAHRLCIGLQYFEQAGNAWILFRKERQLQDVPTWRRNGHVIHDHV